MNKKEPCLNTLIKRLAAADDKAFTLSERLRMIQELIDKHCMEEEELCQDVLDSDKAVVEAIEKLYVEELATRKPEGDA